MRVAGNWTSSPRGGVLLSQEHEGGKDQALE